tara:strand:+ start:3096 stop:4226 length:1131 start_codon:yes stop_codon:yes gene_type:complete
MVKKNILVFAHESSLNGASHSLLTILIGLKSEYNFLVIIPDKGLMEAPLFENNINYKILNIPRCSYFNFKSITDHLKRIYSYYRVKKTILMSLNLICNTFKPDIIYTNTSVISLGFDLSKKINKPHVWHIREYGDTDFNICYIPFRKAIINKIKKSKKSVFTTHLLKKHWLGEMKENSSIIYNGVFDSVNLIKKAQLNRVTRIGIVGLIMENKGQFEAILILNLIVKQNKNVHLFIYGDIYNKEYYKLLENLIIEKSLNKKVYFMGYVENNEIYQNIDILLSSSKNEGFGRTIIEAMSYGIPVVARNSGGPTEIIENGLDGFLYDTVKQGSDRITNLIMNSKLYFDISLRSKYSARSKFSKREYLKSINSIFKEAI